MATRYWIASATNNWNSTANWAATSGGTGGASVPGSGDTAVFDNGNANCIIDVPITLDKITTTGYNGDLIVKEPLKCNSLEWAGKQLFLAESQIGTLSVKRSNANGSKVVFDSFGAKSIAAPPTQFTLTPISKNCTVSWAAIPNRTTYYAQKSTDGGATWSQISTGTATSRTLSITDTQTALVRVAVEIDGVISKYSKPAMARSLEGVNSLGPIDTNPDVTLPSLPVDIGTFEILPGSNTVTIDNKAEVRLTGDVTIPSGITVSQVPPSKFTLLGTQDQDVSASSGVPEFSLNKPAGKVTLLGNVKLRSDLLRSSSEIDPRTATLVDIVFSDASPTTITLSGDIACRSFSLGLSYSEIVIPTGFTLDTYSFTASASTKVSGAGTIRVCQGKYTNTGITQPTTPTIVYWNDPAGPTPPATPNQIFVSGQRTTEIDLWWNTVGGATSYVLERTTNYGNPNSWGQVYNGSATACTDSSLTPGTLYYYRLKAVNASGDSNWSPMLAAATAAYPAPANLTVIKVTADSIALQWTSQYSPIDHLVAWSPNGVDSWTEIQTLSPTSFVFTGLTPETTYYFRVRARYTSANSPWSQVASAKTLPLPEPTNTSDTWSVTKRIAQKFEVKTDFSGGHL